MINHLGTKTLETERLILRRFTIEDANAMFNNWASDSEVTRYLTWQAHPNIEVTKQLLANWVALSNNANCYKWAIVLKETNEAVGNISFVKTDDSNASASLGYVLSKSLWGKGIMPEACKAVFAFGFNELGLNRIGACHHVDNPSSGRVMQKLGMTCEGLKRQVNSDNNGKLCDTMHYAILKQDWNGIT